MSIIITAPQGYTLHRCIPNGKYDGGVKIEPPAPISPDMLVWDGDMFIGPDPEVLLNDFFRPGVVFIVPISNTLELTEDAVQ